MEHIRQDGFQSAEEELHCNHHHDQSHQTHQDVVAGFTQQFDDF